MIKNFEEVKKQLAELSEVINRYKSEQVQLRIVELVFRISEDDPERSESDADPGSKKRRRRKRDKGDPAATEKDKVKKRNAAKGTGPMATLEQFIQDGFFNQKKTIGAVGDHCKAKARNFKPNELSGPLGRLVRNEKLSRTKNSDGQWEYIKK